MYEVVQVSSVRATGCAGWKEEVRVVRVHGENSMNLAGNWLWGKGRKDRKLFRIWGLCLPRLVVQTV